MQITAIQSLTKFFICDLRKIKLELFIIEFYASALTKIQSQILLPLIIQSKNFTNSELYYVLAIQCVAIELIFWWDWAQEQAADHL